MTNFIFVNELSAGRGYPGKTKTEFTTKILY
jgi:hypothetical protein